MRKNQWQEDFYFGKEISLMAKKPCSLQRNLALGKEILLLTIEIKIGTPQRDFSLWQRDFALGKETLLFAKKPCSWQEEQNLDPPYILL